MLGADDASWLRYSSQDRACRCQDMIRIASGQSISFKLGQPRIIGGEVDAMVHALRKARGIGISFSIYSYSKASGALLQLILICGQSATGRPLKPQGLEFDPGQVNVHLLCWNYAVKAMWMVELKLSDC